MKKPAKNVNKLETCKQSQELKTLTQRQKRQQNNHIQTNHQPPLLRRRNLRQEQRRRHRQRPRPQPSKDPGK
jgi:hypothetical protein